MLKMIRPPKPIVAQTVSLRRRLHKLMERTLLLAALSIAVGLALPLHANTHQLLFEEDTIKDPGSLAVKLQDPRAAVSASIAVRLAPGTQQLLHEYDGINSPSPDLQKALLADLNQLLQAGPLYDLQSFVDVERSEQAQVLLRQNPQTGDALIRLNRLLLAAAYPYELASLSEGQTAADSKGIETCKENLRQIKMARENYRTANADLDPQWLSELSPQYLEKGVLLCPADTTIGVPGVLTEGASDPTLPCSYLYEIRPSAKEGQQMLSMQEGGMTPIVRCEHHRLNLSMSGKLYRNGPQRDIYNSNKTGMALLTDFLQELRAQHGEAFLKIKEVREQLKQATEELVLQKFVPKLLSAIEKELLSELEAQLGKDMLQSPIGMSILGQAMPQVRDQVKAQLQAQLEAHLGAEFLKTEEGQDILNQLSVLLSP